jgi:glycosyltransferase involved in cell wall biosynthesis
VLPYQARPRLELEGVVYLSYVNPFDPRKNWQDVLSAYLRALGDRADATLVIKVVVCPELATRGLGGMIGHYKALGLRHRCKLAFVADYLEEPQLVELTRAATYYVNAARAEGANLPLRDALAAGRPGIAPAHTSMADYFSDYLGWVVRSSPEPTCFPHDPTRRQLTSWQRIDWQSLCDAFRASYEVARRHPQRYRLLGEAARRQMLQSATAEQVYPVLAAALESVAGRPEEEERAGAQRGRLQGVGS